MAPAWSTIPLLPLSCILEHLDTKDALSAMSTCRHWRNAILLYEGHKETLKLQAKQLEKNLFVGRIFRKHTHKLHIYIDCNDSELDKFMHFVLPQFLDTERLHELVFVGPGYVQQNSNLPTVKLNRIITETLIFKHKRFLRKLSLLGCALDSVSNDDDRFVHKQVELYSRSLKFNKVPFPGDAILARCNSYAFAYYHLQHLICDYSQLSTECLSTLSGLASLRLISAMVRRGAWRPVDWGVIPGVEVGVNIVSLPYRKLEEVMENILVEDLPLVSLKVMFCDVLYPRLLRHVSSLYKSRLREVVWVDSPLAENRHKSHTHAVADAGGANPFILLCWQCQKLARLVIHGYWVWQYDLLGVVRLSPAALALEVSAVFARRPPAAAASLARVLPHHAPAPLDTRYVTEINSQAKWSRWWRPLAWSELHPGLRARASRRDRRDYLLAELAAGLQKYTH